MWPRSGHRLLGPAGGPQPAMQVGVGARVRARASTARPSRQGRGADFGRRLRPSSRSSLRLDTDCAPAMGRAIRRNRKSHRTLRAASRRALPALRPASFRPRPNPCGIAGHRVISCAGPRRRRGTCFGSPAQWRERPRRPWLSLMGVFAMRSKIVLQATLSLLSSRPQPRLRPFPRSSTTSSTKERASAARRRTSRSPGSRVSPTVGRHTGHSLTAGLRTEQSNGALVGTTGTTNIINSGWQTAFGANSWTISFCSERQRASRR